MKLQLTIQTGQYSTAGMKPENQDFHGILEPEGSDLAAKGIAACVADGISTSQLGAAAAETSVKTFLTDYFCTSAAWSVRNSGERVISATNSWMYAQNRRGRVAAESDSAREQGLICTFSALVIKGRSAHIFHIGDGQIARIEAGGLEELTEPHRINLGGGQSYLGRAMGVNQNVEIDYHQMEISKGDLFMLTTDGVHEVLSSRSICDLVWRADDLAAAAKAICDAALEAGSEDNLTVQLVRISDLPDGGLDELIGHDANLPPVPDLAIGDEFDGYKIVEQLHNGSRSHVYLAEPLGGGDKVALKVLSTELAQSAAAQQSLMLEEWIMRKQDHPNLLKAAPQGPARKFAYSASKYVPGESLYSWMLEHKNPDLADVRGLIKQLATGLETLHRKEMIHRDLRPQNVLVSPEGQVLIIDFGSVQVAGLDELVPQSLEGAFAGTMQYSAPELYLGYSATRRSDQYSLGVIVYQMLTGELPYGPRVAVANTRAAQRKLRYVPVTDHNPDVPDWMDAAICKAVSIEPMRRYDELWDFVTDLGHPNRDLDPPALPTLFHRRSPRLWQVISVILAILLAISLLTRPSQDEPSQGRCQSKVADRESSC